MNKTKNIFIIEELIGSDRVNVDIVRIPVRSVRPGYGLHPKHLESILDKKVNTTLDAGTPMSLEYISE